MASTFASSASATTLSVDPNHLKHKRRFCRHEGCNRIVKSQGLCQRHGAKPRKCKGEGCDKQAQGNFDKMCKAHFKAMKRATTPLPRVPQGSLPPPPQGFSVYDNILPASISYVPRKGSVMPLIAHLKAGFDGLKPPAWHRNEERRARGMHPIDNPATQLEGWERELVWMEILVLTGAPGASFRHLARAWGRDKGFHMVLAQFICERQGDVQRKKRIAEREDQEATSAGDKSRGPAKKRRRLKRNPNLSADVSANIWDDSAYGDVITNEALAADIFDFTPQEFESATALRRWKQVEENSDTASVASQRTVPSHPAAASSSVATAHATNIVPKPPALKVRSTSKMEHPEQNPETSALVLGSADSVSHQGQITQFSTHGVREHLVQPQRQRQHYPHDGEVATAQRHHEQTNQSHVGTSVEIHTHSQHMNPQYHPEVTVPMPMPLRQPRDDHQTQVVPREQMNTDQSRHQQYHHDGGARPEQYQQQHQGNQGHYNDVEPIHQQGQYLPPVRGHPLHEPQYHGDSHGEQPQLHYQGEVRQALPSQYHQHQGHYQTVASPHVETQNQGHYQNVGVSQIDAQHQMHYQEVEAQQVETQHQRHYQEVPAPHLDNQSNAQSQHYHLQSQHVETQHQGHYQDVGVPHIQTQNQRHYQEVAAQNVETQHQRHYENVAAPHLETQHQRHYQDVATTQVEAQHQRHYQNVQAAHIEIQHPRHYQDVATPHVETQQQRNYPDVAAPQVDTEHHRNYQDAAVQHVEAQHQMHYQGAVPHLENQSTGQAQHYPLQGVDMAGVGSGISNQGHSYPTTQPQQVFTAPIPVQYTVNAVAHDQYQTVLADQGFQQQQQQQHELQQRYVQQQQQTMHSKGQNLSSGHDAHAFHIMRDHPEQHPETSALPPDLTHQQYQQTRETQGDDGYNL